jgi:signal peptidase I
MRSLRAVMRTTVTLLAGVIVVTVFAYAALLVAGFRPVAVYSGSMVPALRVGSIAIDRPVPASSVRVGDVITFEDPYVSGRLVTHRVVRIFHTSKGSAYRTKGDANPSRDPWTIRLPGHVGRVQFSIPGAGYVLWYAHTREVRTALIAFAAVLLLAGLLRRIWREEGRAAAAPGDA